MQTSRGAQAVSRVAATVDPWWLWYPKPPDSPSPLWASVPQSQHFQIWGFSSIPTLLGICPFPPGIFLPCATAKPGTGLAHAHWGLQHPLARHQARREPGSPAAGGEGLPRQLPHAGAANKQTNKHPSTKPQQLIPS